MKSAWKYCPYCGYLIDDCGCDGSRDNRFPAAYAEVEYNDFDSAEAIDGARFDDLNYQRYHER